MLDIIYDFVSPWAEASRKQIMKNRFIGRIVNYIYPVYCKLHPIRKKLMISYGSNKNIIVSLTSFPERINTVHLCINSLLRQEMLANHVILWLAKSQFPKKSELPSSLLKLETRGLEIRFCEDLKSYKKVFFTAQEYVDSIIITCDDDTLYPESWIKNLIETHHAYPECVCCYRAHKIILKNGVIVPYNDWLSLSPNIKGPSIWLIPIGVGGVLYPPKYFEKVEFDFDLIKRLCPTTDDLWLKVIGMKNGYKVVKVKCNSKEWFTIKSSQRHSLMHENIGMNTNDKSMNKLINHYHLYELLERGEILENQKE